MDTLPKRIDRLKTVSPATAVAIQQGQTSMPPRTSNIAAAVNQRIVAQPRQLRLAVA